VSGTGWRDVASGFKHDSGGPGATVVESDALERGCGSWARRLSRLREQEAAARLRSEGRCPVPRRPYAPNQRLGGGRLHGGRLLRLGHGLLGRRPDPQGSRHPDRGPRRADRGGHRRLGAHAPNT
jgi:hypothetical protein